ncbi:MAG: MATE family efflux transporter [Lachnospiraceae bacterium]|nr:MATE family efflux transporter [Lachnospiraceae bacterium]
MSQINEKQQQKFQEEMAAENKMGTMPVNRLLVSMAVPLMISNLVQALYNIVDSIFVSRITSEEVVLDAAGNVVSAGTDAIGALGLAFPIQLVIIALAMGTSVGVGSLLSRSLGEGNQKRANSSAMHGIVLMILSYGISLFIGVFLAKACIAGQGATGRTLAYGTTYLRIVCCLSLAVFMEIMFERLLQSTGRSVLAMVAQMVGAIINVIMDPILIFGLFGAPKLGVAGAAYATVFGQIVATILGIYFNVKKNPDIQLHFKEFSWDWNVVKNIYVVGAPAIILQGAGSVMNFGMNAILNSLHATAVAVFTVYYKLQSFFFMPMFGLNNALIPIVAYNYGAKKKHRLKQAHRLAMIYSFGLAMIGFGAFELIPDVLIRIFDTGDASLLSIGVPALRIIGIHYLAAWYCIITGGVFQGVGNGIYSMINSLSRQLVVLLPAAFILSKLGGLDAVWWSFPIAEVASMSLTVYFYTRINRNILGALPDTE